MQEQLVMVGVGQALNQGCFVLQTVGEGIDYVVNNLRIVKCD